MFSMILITWLTISSLQRLLIPRKLAVWPDSFVSVIEFAILYHEVPALQLFHYKLRALQSIMFFIDSFDMKPIVAAFGILQFSLTKVIVLLMISVLFIFIILEKMLILKVITLQNQHLYFILMVIPKFQNQHSLFFNLKPTILLVLPI
jgi:hypothetical protein